MLRSLNLRAGGSRADLTGWTGGGSWEWHFLLPPCFLWHHSRRCTLCFWTVSVMYSQAAQSCPSTLPCVSVQLHNFLSFFPLDLLGLDVVFLSTLKRRSLFWKLCRSKWEDRGEQMQRIELCPQNWAKIQVLPLERVIKSLFSWPKSLYLQFCSSNQMSSEGSE